MSISFPVLFQGISLGTPEKRMHKVPLPPTRDTIHFGFVPQTKRLHEITPDTVELVGTEKLPSNQNLSKEVLLRQLKEAALQAQRNKVYDTGNNGRFFGTSLLMDDGSWHTKTNRVIAPAEAICSERLALADSWNEELVKQLPAEQVARILEAQEGIDDPKARLKLAPRLPKPVLLLVTSDMLGDPVQSCAPCQEWEAITGLDLPIGRMFPDYSKPGHYKLEIEKVGDWLSGYADRQPSLSEKNVTKLPIKENTSGVNDTDIYRMMDLGQKTYERLKQRVSKLYPEFGGNNKINCAVGILDDGTILTNAQWVWTARLFEDPIIGLMQKVTNYSMENPKSGSKPYHLKAVGYYGDMLLPTAAGLNWLYRACMAAERTVPISVIKNNEIHVQPLNTLLEQRAVYLPKLRLTDPRKNDF